ncbi:MAG: hypothetical protein LBK04_00570 [Clostridiales Family XIII bacterium]|nr:hypothetical protein [Clostridiales Family XIII bacterium]
MIDEAYADGEFAKALYKSDMDRFVSDGDGLYNNSWKDYSLGYLGYLMFGIYVGAPSGDFEGYDQYYDRVSDLLGEARLGYRISELGSWSISFVGSSDSTFLNADGFLYESAAGKIERGATITRVTYKLDNDDLSTDCSLTEFDHDDFTYNPDAGYRVYHVLVDIDVT